MYESTISIDNEKGQKRAAKLSFIKYNIFAPNIMKKAWKNWNITKMDEIHV
jgi:hypothetical protein